MSRIFPFKLGKTFFKRRLSGFERALLKKQVTPAALPPHYSSYGYASIGDMFQCNCTLPNKYSYQIHVFRTTRKVLQNARNFCAIVHRFETCFSSMDLEVSTTLCFLCLKAKKPYGHSKRQCFYAFFRFHCYFCQ